MSVKICKKCGKSYYSKSNRVMYCKPCRKLNGAEKVLNWKRKRARLGTEATFDLSPSKVKKQLFNIRNNIDDGFNHFTKGFKFSFSEKSVRDIYLDNLVYTMDVDTDNFINMEVRENDN